MRRNQGRKGTISLPGLSIQCSEADFFLLYFFFKNKGTSTPKSLPITWAVSYPPFHTQNTLDAPDFVADQLAGQAQRLSAFMGSSERQSDDRFFLVLGMTGAGKSTFVARCTGQDVTVGHGLYSCKKAYPTHFSTASHRACALGKRPLTTYLGTNSMGVFDFLWRGRRIYLVDTPGFDDPNRSNIDTLGILAAYLGASYANGVRIHGLILLHPISGNRMSGSGLRNIEMMKAMCGFTRNDNLAIATTMWPNAPDNAEAAILENREIELLTEEKFFGVLIAQGAALFRHNENGHRDSTDEHESARRIVDYLIDRSDIRAPDVLRLQHEMIDQGKRLGDTAAGIAVAADLQKARQAQLRQLRELETQMDDQLAYMDAAHFAELRELRAHFNKKLEEAENEKQTLKWSMEDMHREEERAWKTRFEVLDQWFRVQIAAKEQDLLGIETSLQQLRNDRARRTDSPCRKQQAADNAVEHEEIVDKARRGAVRARDSHRKFRTHGGRLVHGVSTDLAKDLASGIASSTIAARKLAHSFG